MLHKKKVLLLGNTIQAICCSLANVRPATSDENHCIILNLTDYKARIPTQKKQADHQSITADGLCQIVTLLILLRPALLIAPVSDFVQDSVFHSLGEGLGSSITLVFTCQTTRRHIPEECYLDQFTYFIDQVGPSGRPYVAEMLVFWDVTPRVLVEADRCLRVTYCRHTESRIVHSQWSESLKPRISWSYRGFSLSRCKMETEANIN